MALGADFAIIYPHWSLVQKAADAQFEFPSAPPRVLDAEKFRATSAKSACAGAWWIQSPLGEITIGDRFAPAALTLSISTLAADFGALNTNLSDCRFRTAAGSRAALRFLEAAPRLRLLRICDPGKGERLALYRDDG